MIQQYKKSHHYLIRGVLTILPHLQNIWSWWLQRTANPRPRIYIPCHSATVQIRLIFHALSQKWDKAEAWVRARNTKWIQKDSESKQIQLGADRYAHVFVPSFSNTGLPALHSNQSTRNSFWPLKFIVSATKSLSNKWIRPHYPKYGDRPYG